MRPFLYVLFPAAAIFIAFTLALASQPKKTSRRTAIAFFVTGVGAIMCYSYGYSFTCSSIFTAVVRAALSTCYAFLGRNDFSAVSGAPFFQSDFGQFLFWAVHMVALYTTASAALVTLGAGFLRKLRLILAMQGDLILIYGTHSGALEFGRSMQKHKHTSVVFVDKTPAAGSEESVRTMGSILRSDESAISPDRIFLRSIGVRRGGRRVWLYAISGEKYANRQYAEKFLSALKAANIPFEQTTLTLFDSENTHDHDLLNGTNYGYGAVNVINETELAARLLVQSAPPCSVLSFDQNGLAQNDFHCLVIGYGSIGQAVLRALTINGQFAGSTFRAGVFDPNYHSIIGPAAYREKEMLAKYDISFFESDGRSKQLFDYLNDHISTIKYIAVCAGSGKQNEEIAASINTFLRRRGKDILLCVCDHDGIDLLSCGSRKHFPLYSDKILHDSLLDKKAMLLNQVYMDGNALSAKENWVACDYFSRLSCRAAADFSPAFLSMAHITARQVLENGWDPKGDLLENMSITEHMRWCAFHYSMGFEPMDAKTHMDRAKQYTDEMAKYGKSDLRITRDLQRLQHACLVDWELLDQLSEAENAVTGNNTNYKQMDRANVLQMHSLLSVGGEEAL